MRRTLWPFVLTLALFMRPARSATWDYAIALPDGRDATFELPFSVQYDGPVTIEAEWTGPRILFFRVDGPARTTLARRSGPSPQRLETTTAAAGGAGGAGWMLTIKALPARGEASGRLKITVPDSPEIVAKREAVLHPPPPPPPPPPPFMLPRTAPAGASPEVVAVYEAVDAVRARVASDAEGSGDACTWQVGFLTYATAARDRLPAAPPDLPTLRYFERLTNAIRSVELLRTSADPVLAGPAPVNRDALRDWLIARKELVRPIERSLDQLTELLHGGHAPALEDERWLPRFTACLTACERFYDERVRFGSDENAPNGELARAQWERVLAAQRVFAAFGAFLKEPPPP